MRRAEVQQDARRLTAAAGQVQDVTEVQLVALDTRPDDVADDAFVRVAVVSAEPAVVLLSTVLLVGGTDRG